MFMPELFYTMATYGPPNDGGGDWWWIPRILFITLWITIAVFVVRWLVWGRRRGHSPMERAQGILAERYARGEIDAAEYRQRSEELK